jgi:hypothetical protein
MNDLQQYQSEHLFLLVGTNPLPNYVAAKLLLRPSGHIYLVHTDETAVVADRLIASLKLESSQVTKIQVDEAESDNVFEQVTKHAKGKNGVGLNYTGGTKTMAVHAYRAIERACPDAVFSYLDARTICMNIERLGQPGQPHPVSIEVQPNLQILLELHGHTLQSNPKPVPFQPDIAQALAQADCIKLREWCNRNLRKGSDTPFRKKEELKEVALTCVIDWLSAKTLDDLATQWNKRVGEVAEWLDGKWLEDYTLWALQQVAESCHIHQTAMSIQPRERGFEFDVAAMRGYQLFAISCSTETRKGKLKLKLFEAYVRARQMGGDEARVGLVCCAPKDNPESNPAAIQREIEEDWDAHGKVRVFGAEHLPDLPAHLQDWFNSQP